MEDKDINILEEKIDKGYIYVNCGDTTEKALIKLLQAYKQDEKVIKEMARYIKSLTIDYDKIYCNLENCNYNKTKCSIRCIIDHFRKKCE